MSEGVQPWVLVLAPTAIRAIEEKLPETVSAAVAEFIAGALLENPHRVGHELRYELTGRWSARRGAYRVLYAIDDRTRTVTVMVIDHRSAVYRRP